MVIKPQTAGNFDGIKTVEIFMESSHDYLIGGTNARQTRLDKNIDSKTFHEFYYLKEELVDFCRKNNLPASEIPVVSTIKKKTLLYNQINEDTNIEANIVCSEKHRAFFKEHIGSGFSFNVVFQKWLKSNAGKTYKEAIDAYFKILHDKKSGHTKMEQQFEYNAYVREFFSSNKGKCLEDAIKCWKYKKQLPGHNRYESSDLIALD